MANEPNQNQQPDALALVEAGLKKLEEGQKAFREEHIKALSELRATTTKEIEEKSAKGYDSPETKAKIQKLEEAISRFEAEMLRPDGGRRTGQRAKSASDQLLDSEHFKQWKEQGFKALNGRRGVSVNMDGGFFLNNEHDPFGQKSLISIADIGSATSGVQNYARQAGIIEIQRQELRIRDLLNAIPMTTGNLVDYLKENVFTNNASPQTEGAAKAESTITYTTLTTGVKTIAHWMQVTTQALSDIPWLRSNIDSNLMYGLKLKEEREILTGDGLGQHLSGIITQATAYASGTYNVVNDTKLDKLRHFILQSRLALYPVDGIVLNPRDMHDIELIKDGDVANFGRYILGDPRTGPNVAFVWGKPVVESDSISYGYGLVGAFRTGADLFDRMQATIDISFEHGTNFTENEATIRCEERLALAVKRPASFIYGAL